MHYHTQSKNIHIFLCLLLSSNADTPLDRAQNDSALNFAMVGFCIPPVAITKSDGHVVKPSYLVEGIPDKSSQFSAIGQLI